MSQTEDLMSVAKSSVQPTMDEAFAWAKQTLTNLGVVDGTAQINIRGFMAYVPPAEEGGAAGSEPNYNVDAAGLIPSP